MSQRTAIVFFNLGGPDGPDDVRPFLKNLFSDSAIIRAPLPVRFLLSRLISTTRAASARANYAKMGGGSPLLAETRKQAAALEERMAARGRECRVFIAMRYWKPFASDTVREVEAWKPDRIVLLPLYPQFSTTTTASSLKAWTEAGGRYDRLVCCYPTPASFVDAHVAMITKAWEDGGRPANVRVLLSAHGLPETVIRDGDPYQRQVEQTAAEVRLKLPPEWEMEVCYQSRVGPLKWIGPPTDDAIRRAAKDGKTILLSPIAFVSEHIETLVELDEEYREVAHEHGAPGYLRAAALGVEPLFIQALGDLVDEALADTSADPVRSFCGRRICPSDFKGCPNRRLSGDAHCAG
jgi:ferrochelatase